MRRLSFLNEKQQQTMTGSIELVDRFYGESKRRFSNAPASSHLFDVLKVVARYTDSMSVLNAAFLHDLVEDYPEARASVFYHYSDRENHLVSLLTKPRVSPAEDRTLRNDRYWRNLAADKDALLIKLADTLCNLPSGEENENFRARYLAEKKVFIDLVQPFALQDSKTKALFQKLSEAIASLAP